jgi:hypothetical protein
LAQTPNTFFGQTNQRLSEPFCWQNWQPDWTIEKRIEVSLLKINNKLSFHGGFF